MRIRYDKGKKVRRKDTLSTRYTQFYPQWEGYTHVRTQGKLHATIQPTGGYQQVCTQKFAKKDMKILVRQFFFFKFFHMKTMVI